MWFIFGYISYLLMSRYKVLYVDDEPDLLEILLNFI